MNAKDITFLEDTFKKFYFENFDLLHVPDDPLMHDTCFQTYLCLKKIGKTQN